MRNTLYIVPAIVAMVVMSCSDKNGGRPAPNSTPVAPQQNPPPAQPQNNQNNGQAIPSNQQPNGQQNGNTQNGNNPPPLTGKPPPGKPPQLGGGQTTTIINSRVIYFDNQGAPQNEVIESEAFFVKNFDGANLPQTRVLTIDSGNGNKKTLSGAEYTHLFDENYLSCGNPECLNKIGTKADYNKFAQSCLSQTVTNQVARFEFYFNKKGTLSFVATVDNIRYGAKNITYTYDGSRELFIAPFIATAVINEKDNVAIAVTGMPLNGETAETIRAIKNVENDPRAFRVKANIQIMPGKVEEGRFVTKGIQARFVSGVWTKMVPVSSQAFKALDAQE